MQQRRWIRGLVIATAIGIGCVLSVSAQAPKKSAIQATSTRPDAVYKVGETATFKIESDVDGDATYRLTEDGHKAVKNGTLKLEKGKAVEVAGTLEKPGFLQLQVTLGKENVLAAAAFDPTKIEPTAKVPADFDTFWEAQKKELAKIPLDAKLEHSPKHSDARVDCYKISLASVDGKRVHGWISVPKGKGPFPAILTVPYAGVYGIEPDKRHAQMGALAMNIIVHDLPVDEKGEFYEKQADGPLKDYRNIGMNDRQKSYFRQAILACLRAVDYIATRPDFNGKDLAVTGGSQGGGLAIITAGADPRVTLLAAAVPALCDHSGIASDRISGWPQWLRRVKGDEAAKVLETSAYFDAVNFARKFKGKSVLAVGFIDTACPPTSVYSAFNALPEPKTMVAAPRLGHATDPKYGPARDDLWKKNLPLKPPE
ncbi:MAG: acetylxylan esterase [Gemmataceae bacterium]|nr:acetylxylan esterase [Gemmataceae bacterium]